jgi:hypothetical protein
VYECEVERRFALLPYRTGLGPMCMCGCKQRPPPANPPVSQPASPSARPPVRPPCFLLLPVRCRYTYLLPLPRLRLLRPALPLSPADSHWTLAVVERCGRRAPWTKPSE